MTKKTNNKRDLSVVARDFKRKNERCKNLAELNSSSLFFCFYLFMGMYSMEKMIDAIVLLHIINKTLMQLGVKQA